MKKKQSPIRSMTGHGRGEATEAGGIRVTVECSSVNRKQAEVQVNLPREYFCWEVGIREMVLEKVTRGRVQISVSVEAATSGTEMRLQMEVARTAFQQMKQLQKELQLEEEIRAADLFALPGVWKIANIQSDTKAAWSAVQKALLTALEGMLRMREREGKHLFDDLKKRSQRLRRILKQIRNLLPALRKYYQNALKERLDAAGAPQIDERRLMEEVAWFCEKSDISEELTRLDSHFVQFDEYLHTEGSIGRTLEFLAQEIFRELNTLSAKANSADISQLVVDCKAELDKMREQISNIE